VAQPKAHVVMKAKAILKPTARPARPKTKPTESKGAEGVVLLAGGNPQIAKGDGDAPVQAYIDATPGWKQAVVRRLDALIARAVPGVAKAVKWNSPFYGVAPGDWFLSFHGMTKYVKIAFFRGAAMTPSPPVASKQKDVRYFHIHENDTLNEA
jgi:hypothetical protein